MPSQPTDLPGIFRRAVQVLEANGLHKGAFVAPAAVEDPRGCYHLDNEALRPVDVVGAIRIACGQQPTSSGGFTAERAIRFGSLHMPTEAPLTDGEPDYVEHLSFWSDLGASTVHEVMARLEFWAITAEVDAERSVAA